MLTEELCRDRSEMIASYMIEHKVTVREAAKHFHVSKSTVHKDVTEKLKYINPSLHDEVGKLLAVNKSERHIRGGEATRRKYQRMHERRLHGTGRKMILDNRRP